MTRVVLLGDPMGAMGSLAEPECRRILAGLDLAEKMGVPLEWFALSAGAKIAMDSGTENMDWISRVLRRLITFTQAGGEVNVVVCGINVGAQPYWNAEATMLMHTRGILVMTPDGAMVLTGKTALDYSGSVSAEDNLGIGGYERVMGPNGQAQYWARDIPDACRILLRHYDHTYVVPGERFPRRAETADPIDRDVCPSPHGGDDPDAFALVGEIFSDETNPGRKRPFEIRKVMAAAADQDHPPLERWAGMRDAENGVVWDAHLGGWPVCLLGFESRPVKRIGFVATDGPENWTVGHALPARLEEDRPRHQRGQRQPPARRPREPLRLRRLARVDAEGPARVRRRDRARRHELPGAHRLHRRLALPRRRVRRLLEDAERQHGGRGARGDLRLRHRRRSRGGRRLRARGRPADEEGPARSSRSRRRSPRRPTPGSGSSATSLAELVKAVRSEKLGQVADEFDGIHSVQRALAVGSLDRILPAAELRPYLVDAIERGMAKEMARIGR